MANMDNATGFAKALQLHTSNFVTLATHNLHKIELVYQLQIFM